MKARRTITRLAALLSTVALSWGILTVGFADEAAGGPQGRERQRRVAPRRQNQTQGFGRVLDQPEQVIEHWQAQQREPANAVELMVLADAANDQGVCWPRVSVIATGDEVVAPGVPLRPGQLYASNLFALSAWLGAFGIAAVLKIPFSTVQSRIFYARRKLREHLDTSIIFGGESE